MSTFSFPLAALATAGLLGAQVVPMRYSDIVKQADVIAVGTVTKAESRHEEGGKTIRTYVKFEKLDLHKGKAPGGTITLQLEGGKVGEDTLRVTYMPRFVVGRRYLIYVRPDNFKALSPIVGFNQGAFEVKPSKTRQVLVGVANGLELVGIREDRFVFADRDVQPRANAIKAVPVPGFRVVPAFPNVSELEEAAARRMARSRADEGRGLTQLPAKNSPEGSSAGLVVAAPRKGAGEAPLEDWSPILVSAKRDKGVRASVKSILPTSIRTEARNAARRGQR